MLVSKFLFEGNLFWENLNSYFFFLICLFFIIYIFVRKDNTEKKPA